MSRSLSRAKREYLHTPVDDLESFFWVALWSVMFNEKSGPWNENEEDVRKFLLKIDKDAAISEFILLHPDRCNHHTRWVKATMKDWWLKVRDRQLEWVSDVMVKIPKGADQESYFQLHFHRFALRGVLDVLEVLHIHWEGEIGRESWT